MTINMLLLIFFCILSEGMSQLCLKHAASADTSFLRTLLKPMVWLGILFWAADIVAWIFVLQYVPLTIAFPTMSLTYVTTLIGGAIVFKERVNKRHIIGALLITAGVACAGASGI